MLARAAMPKASLSQASDSTRPTSTLTTSAQELPSAVLTTNSNIQSEVEEASSSDTTARETNVKTQETAAEGIVPKKKLTFYTSTKRSKQ